MLPRLLFSILLVSLVPFSAQSHLIDLNVVYSYHQLPENIAHIINSFLTPLTMHIDFIIAFEAESQKMLQLDMLNVLLPHLGLRTTVTLSGFWEQSRSMFILADSYKSFHRAMFSTNNNQFESIGYYIVYITEYITPEELSSIFKHSLEHHIINIGLIMSVPFMNNELFLYTYFPFGPGKCYDHDPTPICIYTDGIFLTRTGEKCIFFPEKLSNFHGCELVVNTLEMPPYLTFNQDSQGEVSVSGLEGEVLNTIAAKLNFKAAFLTFDKYKTGNRVKSFTAGSANVSIGRLRSTTIRRRNVSSSTAYYKSDLVMVIHLGRRLYSMERLFSPASRDVWFSFGIFMASAYAVVLLVNIKCPTARKFILGTGNREPTYWLWVTTLGGPVEYNPRRNFARYMLMQWVLLTFFLRSGYQSFFYKSIRMNWKVNTANSLVDALDNGYEMIATSDTIQSLSDISLLEGHVTVFNGSEIEALESLQKHHKKLMVISPKEVFRYYQRMTNHSNLTRIKEPLLEQMICMHFRTNSYFEQPFNRNLQLLGVSGLLPHWRNVHVPTTEKPKGPPKRPEKIVFLDVVGHFQVYFLGIIHAIMGLVVEFISLKVRFIRRMFY